MIISVHTNGGRTVRALVPNWLIRRRGQMNELQWIYENAKNILKEEDSSFNLEFFGKITVFNTSNVSFISFRFVPKEIR